MHRLAGTSVNCRHHYWSANDRSFHAAYVRRFSLCLACLQVGCREGPNRIKGGSPAVTMRWDKTRQPFQPKVLTRPGICSMISLINANLHAWHESNILRENGMTERSCFTPANTPGCCSMTRATLRSHKTYSISMVWHCAGHSS
jgi:hypothetical protein